MLQDTIGVKWIPLIISPILKALAFASVSKTDPLALALQSFKNKDGVITDKAPTDFLGQDECKALTDNQGAFKPSLYKVFLFQS